MKYYPPSLNCTWRITVPKGHLVNLTIQKLDWIDNCADYIVFFDGLSLSDHVITTYCGINSPTTEVIHSRDWYMTVHFVSDTEYYGRFEGFNATFIAQPMENLTPFEGNGNGRCSR